MIATSSPLTATSPAPGRPRLRRSVLLLVAPIGWILAALLHPAPDESTLYADLAASADRWLGVHLAQLLLTVAMGATLWCLVRGRSGVAARMTRLAVPVYLVFFTAFDAVAGVASGLAVRHAESLTGADQAGAASTAEYMLQNRYAGELSPVAAVASFALVAAVIGVALTLRANGARRPIWLASLGALLLNFHAAGPLPIAGLIAFTIAVFVADRDGLVRRDGGDGHAPGG